MMEEDTEEKLPVESPALLAYFTNSTFKFFIKTVHSGENDTRVNETGGHNWSQGFKLHLQGTAVDSQRILNIDEK